MAEEIHSTNERGPQQFDFAVLVCLEDSEQGWPVHVEHKQNSTNLKITCMSSLQKHVDTSMTRCVVVCNLENQRQVFLFKAEPTHPLSSAPSVVL